MSKIKKIEELRLYTKKKNISLVHGVFDLIHLGHKRHFEIAKSYADYLVVSITADKYVNKGPNRPFFNEKYRAEMISSFDMVDAVYINHEPTSVDLISKLRPKYYIKGGDYKNAKNDITRNILKEKKEVEKFGGKIIFTDDIQFSSSKLINESYLANQVNLNKKPSEKIKFRDDCFSALKKINKLKVAVVGEMIFDKYIFCKEKDRPSKELITAVEEYESKNYLGGIYAIAKNISEFCQRIDIITEGNFNQNQKKSLEKNLHKGMKLKLFKSKFNAITKTRYINSTKKKLFEVYQRNGNEKFTSSEKILNFLNKNIKSYDVVVIADFGHGFFNEKIKKILVGNSKFLCINAQTNADNRGFNLITKYNKADSVVIDEPEIRLALSSRYEGIESLSKKLLKKIKTKYLIVTMGPKGIYMIKKNNNKISSIKFSGFEVKPVDTIGAGDAVFGISSLLLLKEKNIEVTAFISNIFGALTTQYLGHESFVKKLEVEKTIQYLLK